MTLRVEIEADNAAFEDRMGTELARILRELAKNLEHPGKWDVEYIPLFDLNGNRVGQSVLSDG